MDDGAPVIDWRPDTPTNADTPTRAGVPGWAWVAVVVGIIGLIGLALAEGALAPGTGPALDAGLGADPQGQAIEAPTSLPIPLDLPIVGLGLLALALLGGGVVAARARGPRRLIGIGLIVATIATVASTLTAMPLVRANDGWLDGDNVGEVSHDGLVRFSTYPLAPDEAARFAFIVGNDGALPMTILGFAGEPFVDGVRTTSRVARVVGLGALPEAGDVAPGDIIDLADASVPWPYRLDPGRRLAIVPLIRGGPCAEPTADLQGGATFIPEVTLVYRVAGWPRLATLDLPVTVNVPGTLAC